MTLEGGKKGMKMNSDVAFGLLVGATVLAVTIFASIMIFAPPVTQFAADRPMSFLMVIGDQLHFKSIAAAGGTDFDMYIDYQTDGLHVRSSPAVFTPFVVPNGEPSDFTIRSNANTDQYLYFTFDFATRDCTNRECNITYYPMKAIE